MKDQIFHEKKEYRDIREIVEDVGEIYKERTVYSFKKKPSDKEIVKISYEQFREDVRALSTELIAMGCRGKKCAVSGALSYKWICLYYSVLSIGAVLVPLDKDWHADDLADTVKKADAEYFFCDSDMTDKAEIICRESSIESLYFIDGSEYDGVDALIQRGNEKISDGDNSYYQSEIDPDALALLVFTSGTTGKGKGVMLSQTAIVSDITDVLPYIDFGERSIAVLPPHHTYGSTVSILGHTLAGCEVYISAGLRYIQKELREQRPQHLVLVPLYLETFYRKIISGLKEKGKEKSFKIGSKISKTLRGLKIDARRRMFAEILDIFGGELRLVVSGGAHINEDIVEFFDTLGITVLNGYGITECAPIVAVNHSGLVTKGSVGIPLSINDVKIANPGEQGEGEICVKGSNVMIGYYKDPEATAAAFDDEGYFRTGDFGKFGKNGALFITGRLKNLIILSNGKNVYPEEIESEFTAVPGIIDIVVYEGESKRGNMYNAIVAEIYPDTELLTQNGVEDIKEYFQTYVNNYNKTAVPYKKIGIIKIRNTEFPKNTLRKIMRFKIDKTIN